MKKVINSNFSIVFCLFLFGLFSLFGDDTNLRGRQNQQELSNEQNLSLFDCFNQNNMKTASEIIKKKINNNEFVGNDIIYLIQELCLKLSFFSYSGEPHSIENYNFTLESLFYLYSKIIYFNKYIGIKEGTDYSNNYNDTDRWVKSDLEEYRKNKQIYTYELIGVVKNYLVDYFQKNRYLDCEIKRKANFEKSDTLKFMIYFDLFGQDRERLSQCKYFYLEFIRWHFAEDKRIRDLANDLSKRYLLVDLILLYGNQYKESISSKDNLYLGYCFQDIESKIFFYEKGFDVEKTENAFSVNNDNRYYDNYVALCFLDHSLAKLEIIDCLEEKKILSGLITNNFSFLELKNSLYIKEIFKSIGENKYAESASLSAKLMDNEKKIENYKKVFSKESDLFNYVKKKLKLNIQLGRYLLQTTQSIPKEILSLLCSYLMKSLFLLKNKKNNQNFSDDLSQSMTLDQEIKIENSTDIDRFFYAYCKRLITVIKTAIENDKTNCVVIRMEIFSIGEIYFSKKDYNRGIFIFQTAKDISTTIRNKKNCDKFIFDCLMRLGDCNFELKKYGDALKCYEQASIECERDQRAEFKKFVVSKISTLKSDPDYQKIVAEEERTKKERQKIKKEELLNNAVMKASIPLLKILRQYSRDGKIEVECNDDVKKYFDFYIDKVINGHECCPDQGRCKGGTRDTAGLICGLTKNSPTYQGKIFNLFGHIFGPFLDETLVGSFFKKKEVNARETDGIIFDFGSFNAENFRNALSFDGENNVDIDMDFYDENVTGEREIAEEFKLKTLPNEIELYSNLDVINQEKINKLKRRQIIKTVGFLGSGVFTLLSLIKRINVSKKYFLLPKMKQHSKAFASLFFILGISQTGFPNKMYTLGKKVVEKIRA